jgi:hypothetical protein
MGLRDINKPQNHRKLLIPHSGKSGVAKIPIAGVTLNEEGDWMVVVVYPSKEETKSDGISGRLIKHNLKGTFYSGQKLLYVSGENSTTGDKWIAGGHYTKSFAPGTFITISSHLNHEHEILL